MPIRRRAVVAQAQHLDAAAGVADRQRRAVEPQRRRAAVPRRERGRVERRGHRVEAFGPRQHGAALRVAGTAVARGEVVQTGPRGHARRVGAVVVAAAVVEVPAQRGVDVSLAIEPRRERQRVERRPARVGRRERDRHGEHASAVGPARIAQRVDEREEAADRRSLARRRPPRRPVERRRVDVDRQQPVVPASVAEQPLVGRMDDDALVVGRLDRADAVGQHAEVGEHRAHVRRFERRQRQVVRAGRIAQPLATDDRAARRGVAVRLRSGDECEARVSFAREPPRGGQTRDAGADDRDVGRVVGRRRRPVGRLRVAQPVPRGAARIADARRDLLPAPEPDAGRGGGPGDAGRQQQRATLHGSDRVMSRTWLLISRLGSLDLTGRPLMSRVGFIELTRRLLRTGDDADRTSLHSSFPRRREPSVVAFDLARRARTSPVFAGGRTTGLTG